MTKHVSVLLHEAISSLDLREGKTLLDGTLGGGGHSAFALESLGGKLKVIGVDRDPEALERVKERLRTYPRVTYKQASFRDIGLVLKGLGIEHVDAVLFDLGLSSDQLEVSGRGFSFMKDEPLDMRMSKDGLTAADILNNWDEETLELILRGFGEERYSRRIAKEIARRRELTPFTTTTDLLEAVRAATPTRYHHGRIHFATRAFQALRMAVNDELPTLEAGLRAGWEALAPGGRMAVIAFHSLEDRVVKNIFKEFAKEGGTILTKKPIVPSEEEVRENPRSRSAKLRVIQK